MVRTATKRVAVALGLIVAVVGLSACGNTASTSSTAIRVRVSGSGTCLPALRILSDEYERNRNVRFVYLPGLHSSGGIRGVAHGDLDIGAVSRELTEEEQALGLDYIAISDDGLVLAVHPTAGISALTSEQVRDVYAGLYGRWSELGGADVEIKVLDRSEDESAKIVLRQHVLLDTQMTDRAVVLTYEQDMVDALEKTPGAIGYFSLGLGVLDAPEVVHLALDGVEPSVANIASGAYRMTRPLGMVVPSLPDAKVAEFVSWATTDEARAFVREHGFAPPLSTTGE